MSWKKIGGPADSLAIFAGRLAALAPDKKNVFMLEPYTTSWLDIGGPAESLIGGGWDLYAVVQGEEELRRYNGKTWDHIDGFGSHFVSIGNSLYALDSETGNASRYNRYANKWTKIGPSFERLIGGGSKLYAATENNGEILEYRRYTDQWKKIGEGGAMWVGVGGTVYGLAPDKSAIYKYKGIPGKWAKIHGTAKKLIGGGSTVYAVDASTDAVLRYSGTGNKWEEVGTPGVGFVAYDHTIYGMKTDKSEVYQLTEENAETKRLRKSFYQSFAQPGLRNRVVRGFLVKEVAGEVIAECGAEAPFLPMSTIKILPYLHVFIEIDQGRAGLNSWVRWVTDGDVDTSCLAEGTPGTTTDEAEFSDALKTMMWESHGRTLDAFLNIYGPKHITARAQDLGLNQTEGYLGCTPEGDAFPPWFNNMTTLYDLAKLWDGIERLKFVSKATTRNDFREHMIKLTAVPGASYTSTKITGRTTGPFNNEFLRPLVVAEAGPAHAAVVDPFMKDVVIRGKGGGATLPGKETGWSDFVEISLPIKTKGKKKNPLRRFLVGWYLGQMYDPEPLRIVEGPKLEAFKLELFTMPIRLALQSWIVSPPKGGTP